MSSDYLNLTIPNVGPEASLLNVFGNSNRSEPSKSADMIDVTSTALPPIQIEVRAEQFDPDSLQFAQCTY